MRPVLVVVGGLPATGRSTIARILAEQTKTPAARLITSKIRTARTETSDPAPEDDAAGISYTGKGLTDEHLG